MDFVRGENGGGCAEEVAVRGRGDRGCTLAAALCAIGKRGSATGAQVGVSLLRGSRKRAACKNICVSQRNTVKASDIAANAW